MKINVKIYLTTLLFNIFIILFHLFTHLFKISFFYIVQSSYAYRGKRIASCIRILIYTQNYWSFNIILVEIFAALVGAKKNS